MTTDIMTRGLDAAKRKAAERKRKRELGLAPLEIWAPKAAHQRIKRYAERVSKEYDSRAPVSRPGEWLP